MISVNCSSLQTGYDELIAVCSTLIEVKEEVDDIGSVMLRPNRVNRAQLVLNECLRDLQNEINQCVLLLHALDRIDLLYSSCECRNMANCEGESFIFPQQVSVLVDLSESASLLREFAVDLGGGD